MNDLISVIVPVYNVEKYLNRCVDSILAQSYTNLEVILVDDGSPDNCPAICDAYAKKDKRVKVIHKVNGGLSDARNAGLDVAKGDFIAFVDSDDWIDCTMYEKLHKDIVNNHADMCVCNFVYVRDVDNEISSKTDMSSGVYKVNKFDLLFSDHVSAAIVVAWNKLYKKELFSEIRYPFGKINEDEFVIYDLIDKCLVISVIDEQLYYYRIRANSIMTTKTPSAKMLDVLDALKERMEKVYNTQYYCFAVKNYLYNIVLVYSHVYNDKMLRKKLFKLYKEKFKLIKYLSIGDKLKYMAFRLFPHLIYNVKYKQKKEY